MPCIPYCYRVVIAGIICRMPGFQPPMYMAPLLSKPTSPDCSQLSLLSPLSQQNIATFVIVLIIAFTILPTQIRVSKSEFPRRERSELWLPTRLFHETITTNHASGECCENHIGTHPKLHQESPQDEVQKTY
jgi:hypothetical protein